MSLGIVYLICMNPIFLMLIPYFVISYFYQGSRSSWVSMDVYCNDTGRLLYV